MLPLFCYCQLDNFAWGTRGIDASEANGEGNKGVVEKKPYEVCAVVSLLNLLLSSAHRNSLKILYLTMHAAWKRSVERCNAMFSICAMPVMPSCYACYFALSAFRSLLCLAESCWILQVGYKCMRPRTNKRSAFATKCMVLAAYLTVNMGIGCIIAITTTWFWWVYMMMGILLFLLGVRIIIFGLSLIALIQFSRRHRRQRKNKAARAAAVAVKALRDSSCSDLGSGTNLLQPQQEKIDSMNSSCSELGSGTNLLQSQQQQANDSMQAMSSGALASESRALHQPVRERQLQMAWGSFAAMQNGSQRLHHGQLQHPLALRQHSARLQPEWCKHSPV